MKKVVMPKLKDDMESGVLCAWCAEEGEHIVAGDALFEVEAAKVVSSVEADVSGKIVRLAAEEGDEIAVGEVIAEIEED